MDDADDQDPLLAAHPALRAVAPPESPFRGVLRRAAGSDRTRLFVDTADYGDSGA